jgi:DNA polymerase-1
VPGVGPKTAAELLREFGSVSAIFEHLGAVEPERLRTNLAAARDQVRRNLDLIRLKAELPCEVSWSDLAVRPPETDQLRPLLERWGFRSLLRDLEAPSPSQAELF